MTLVNRLSNIGANSNVMPPGTVPNVGIGAGLGAIAGTAVEVRNCRFKDNSFGVQISPHHGSNWMTGIDLGQADEPGRNEFSDNYPDVYVLVPPAGSGVLRAAGNTFDGHDCRTASNYQVSAMGPLGGVCGFNIHCGADFAFDGSPPPLFNVVVNDCKGW